MDDFDKLYEIAEELNDVHLSLRNMIRRKTGFMKKELNVIESDLRNAMLGLEKILNELA